MDCITIEGIPSTLASNAISMASCPATHTTLVSCGIKSLYGITTDYARMHGAYAINHNSTCVAVNADYMVYTIAYARCCDFSLYNISCVTYDSPVSANTDAALVSVSCTNKQPGSTLMGCGPFKNVDTADLIDASYSGADLHTNTDIMSGVLFNTDETCNALNGFTPPSGGIIAKGTCCSSHSNQVNVSIKCKSIWGKESAAITGAFSNISCPYPYVMTSCSSYSTWSSSNQWYINNDRCNIPTKVWQYAETVWSNAICCRAIVFSESPTTTVPTTSVPTYVPTNTPITAVPTTLNPTTIHPTTSVQTYVPTIYPTTNSPTTYGPTTNVPTKSPGVSGSIGSETTIYLVTEDANRQIKDESQNDVVVILISASIVSIVLCCCIAFFIVIIIKYQNKTKINDNVSTNIELGNSKNDNDRNNYDNYNKLDITRVISSSENPDMTNQFHHAINNEINEVIGDDEITTPNNISTDEFIVEDNENDAMTLGNTNNDKNNQGENIENQAEGIIDHDIDGACSDIIDQVNDTEMEDIINIEVSMNENMSTIQ